MWLKKLKQGQATFFNLKVQQDKIVRGGHKTYADFESHG
jgi:hypothetical protein